LSILPAAALIVASAGPASATNSGTHYCLTNATSFCWDVKDNSYTAGQPVWLFSSSGGNGLGFHGFVQETVCNGTNCAPAGPFTDHALDSKYAGDSVMYFVAGTSNLCVRLLTSTAAIVLSGSGSCGIASTLWVKAGTRLVNVAGSDAISAPDLFTAASASDEAALSGKVAGIGWQQWNA
jgi:hypothetical protein